MMQGIALRVWWHRWTGWHYFSGANRKRQAREWLRRTFSPLEVEDANHLMLTTTLPLADTTLAYFRTADEASSASSSLAEIHYRCISISIFIGIML